MSSENREIKTVALVVKLHSQRASECASDVSKCLRERDITVLIQKEYSHLNLAEGVRTVSLDTIRRKADLIISLGGDGTLIEAVKTSGIKPIPIFGVNLGGKGFLTEVSPSELETCLPKVLQGKFKTEERIRLAVKHHLHNRKNKTTRVELAVNEALITKAALSKMVMLRLLINDDPVANYRGDGLIISSPTGSTAYSMSAGGPILHPSQKAMLITPICSHTLTQRPFVVPAGMNIKLELISSHREVYATIDGRDGRHIERGDVLEVEISDAPFWLVRVTPRNFFQVLRNKLSWAYEAPQEEQD